MGLSRLKSDASAFMATLLGVMVIFPSSSNADTPAPQPKHLPSRTTILDFVKRYTGFDESDNVEKIEAVPLSEISIPFLSSKLKDETGIRVTFAPGKIKWPPPLGDTEDAYERHLSIYLDADVRRLLAVTIRLAARPADIQVLPLEEQERRLRNGNKVYESFPAVEPKVNFLKALAATSVRVLRAREIDGFYLNVRLANDKSKMWTEWIMIIRGFPPTRVDTAEFRSTFTTQHVNPFTGEWMGSGTNMGPGF